MSAQVFALPTSIAVKKFPCWFAISYESPMNSLYGYEIEFSLARPLSRLSFGDRRTRLRTRASGVRLLSRYGFPLPRRRHSLLRASGSFPLSRGFLDFRFSGRCFFRNGARL